jgi:hypothetical protein
LDPASSSTSLPFSEQKNHFFIFFSRSFPMKELNVEQMAALEGGCANRSALIMWGTAAGLVGAWEITAAAYIAAAFVC